jgi:hypothetical protein
MNAFVKTGAVALALAAAAPAYAGSVAACVGHNEDRQGVTNFEGYTVAVSEAADVDTSTLRGEAEAGFRDRYGDPGRLICETHSGHGHYVVVGGGIELNGQVRNLIGFGFGSTRAAALADSDDRLNDVVEYIMFRDSGGRLTVIEEGEIGG